MPVQGFPLAAKGGMPAVMVVAVAAVVVVVFWAAAAALAGPVSAHPPLARLALTVAMGPAAVVAAWGHKAQLPVMAVMAALVAAVVAVAMSSTRLSVVMVAMVAMAALAAAVAVPAITAAAYPWPPAIVLPMVAVVARPALMIRAVAVAARRWVAQFLCKAAVPSN